MFAGTTRFFTYCCDCLGVEKEWRCGCWCRKGREVSLLKMGAAETIQWPRAFFSEISVGLYQGSNAHTTVLASAAFGSSSPLGHHMLERHMFNVRLEALDHCGVHAKAGHNNIHRYVERTVIFTEIIYL